MAFQRTSLRDRSPFKDRKSSFLAGKFGMTLFLTSLAVLFAANIVGFLVIRILASDWSSLNLPDLPRLLWLSTGMLAVSSCTMHMALMGAQGNHQMLLRIGMATSTLFGIGFLFVQCLCWRQWYVEAMPRMSDMQSLAWTGFYVFTMLHAAHVIGGLIPMAVVTNRAFAGAYSTEKHEGVHYCVMYWHFLGAVWLVLLATLHLGM